MCSSGLTHQLQAHLLLLLLRVMLEQGAPGQAELGAEWRPLAGGLGASNHQLLQPCHHAAQRLLGYDLP